MRTFWFFVVSQVIVLWVLAAQDDLFLGKREEFDEYHRAVLDGSDPEEDGEAAAWTKTVDDMHQQYSAADAGSGELGSAVATGGEDEERRLAGNLDDGKVNVNVQVTFFGYLGDEEEDGKLSNYEDEKAKRIKKARQWMFMSVLKMLTYKNKLTGETPTITWDKEHQPEVVVEEVEPLALDLNPIAYHEQKKQVVWKDQRSPLKRTHFLIKIKNQDKDMAMKLADNICKQYDNTETSEAVLMGFKRTMDSTFLYLNEGIGVAGKFVKEHPLKSVIHLNSYLTEWEGRCTLHHLDEKDKKECEGGHNDPDSCTNAGCCWADKIGEDGSVVGQTCYQAKKVLPGDIVKISDAGCDADDSAWRTQLGVPAEVCKFVKLRVIEKSKNGMQFAIVEPPNMKNKVIHIEDNLEDRARELIEQDAEHVQATALPGGQGTLPCKSTQVKWGDDKNEGVLYMRPCPENSERCEDQLKKEDKSKRICSPDEIFNQGWKCKCTFGFDDDLHPIPPDFKINADFLKNEGDLEIKYGGSCTKRGRYCPEENDPDPDSHKPPARMVQPGTEPGEDGHRPLAKGELDEVAEPECKQGYTHSGTSTCKPKESGKGAWKPTAWCKFNPVKEPPAPECDEPQTKPGLQTRNCKCRALTEVLDLKGQTDSCLCYADCEAGYKEEIKKDQPSKAGHKKCKEIKEGKTDCPPASETTWNNGEAVGKKCSHNGEIIVGFDFCCKEAWGLNPPQTPAALHKVDNCETNKKDDDCLLSEMDKDGKTPPCAWREEGYLDGKAEDDPSQVKCVPLGDDRITESKPPTAIAVPPRVPLGRFEEMPTCVKKCENVFPLATYEIQSAAESCDECIPGDDLQVPCDCRVACKSGLVRFGGSDPGLQKCAYSQEAQKNVFVNPPVCLVKTDYGDVVPICATPVAYVETPTSGGVTRTVTSKVEGCNRCKAGDPQEQCKCEVTCAPGYLPAKDSPDPGTRECQEKPADLGTTKSCQEYDVQEDCLKARDKDNGDAPCCWRVDGFADPNVKCLPKGNSDIRVGKEPTMCASMKKAEFPPLPKCEKKCTNTFKEVEGIKVDADFNECDNCIASKPEDCKCKVKCDRGNGYVYIGGGAEKERKCGAEGFGAAPVCWKPDPDKGPPIPDGDGDGDNFLAEVRSECISVEQIFEQDPGRRVAGCRKGDGSLCKARQKDDPPDPDCPCTVECAETHDRRDLSDRPAGDKKCLEVVSNADELSDQECDALSGSKDQCLNSKKNGKPCCYSAAGFDDSGALKCLERGSDRITKAPDACANLKAAKWDPELPTCDRKCVDIFTGVSADRHLKVSGPCDKCTDYFGTTCSCTVECDEEAGYTFAGGVPTGPRHCSPYDWLGDGRCKDDAAYLRGKGEEKSTLELCLFKCTQESDCVYVSYSPEWQKHDRATCLRYGSASTCAKDQEREELKNDYTSYQKKALSSYTELNGDCPGNEIGSAITGVTATGCAVECDKVQGCVGFSFKQEECLLKSVACKNPTVSDDPVSQSIFYKKEASSWTEAISFQGPPVCMKKEKAGVLERIKCDKPPDDRGAFTFDDCDNCVGIREGMEDCQCKVGCNAADWGIPGEPGDRIDTRTYAKTCKLVEATLDTANSCEEITDVAACRKSKDRDGNSCCVQPAGFLEDGAIKQTLVCAPIGSGSRMGFSADGHHFVVPEDCAKVNTVEWDAMPDCKQRCINHFEGMPSVSQADCDKNCFVDTPGCQCKVQCETTKEPKFRFVPSADVPDEKVPRTCSTSRAFGSPPRCEPFKPPTGDPVCPPPPNAGDLVFPSACNECKANNGERPCDGCEIGCAKGQLMWKPDGLGYTMDSPTTGMFCTKEFHECPLPSQTVWDEATNLCYYSTDGTLTNPTKKDVKAHCCPLAWPTPKTDPGRCEDQEKKDGTPMDNCLKVHELRGDVEVPCCYREKLFQGGLRHCAAQDDTSLINDANKPDACSNRPAIRIGKWSEFPKCAPICDSSMFSPAALPIEVTNCDRCIDKTVDPAVKCECEVNCKSSDLEFVGGGKPGKRMCTIGEEGRPQWFTKGQTGQFDEVGGSRSPICTAKEVKPACKLPSKDLMGEGAVYDTSSWPSRGCQADDGNCKVPVTCKTGNKRRGSPHYVPNPDKIQPGIKSCVSKARSLRDLKAEGKTCADLSEDRKACIGSYEGTDSEGKIQVCCYRGGGFSKNGKKCLSRADPTREQSEEHDKMIYPPDMCAASMVYDWCDSTDTGKCGAEAMPTCLLECNNNMKGNPDLDVTNQCDTCIADRDCPGCRMTCKSGLVRVGGGQENKDYTCYTSSTTVGWEVINPTYVATPVCIKQTDLTFNECGKPSTSAIYKSKVIGCKGCEPNKPCDCVIACKDGYAATAPGYNPNGPHQCKPVPRTDMITLENCKTSKQSKCLMAKDQNGIRCCYNYYGHNSNPDYCLPFESKFMEKSYKVQCAQTLTEEWKDPMCKKICKNDFSYASNVIYDEGACASCVQGQDEDCKAKCTITCDTANGYERYGGGSEGPRICPDDPEPSYLEQAPLCLLKAPNPVCATKEAIPIDDQYPQLNFDTCRSCVAGEDCPGCNIQCRDKFKPRDTKGNGVTCKKFKRPIKTPEKVSHPEDLTRLSRCSDTRTKSKCLESVGINDQPCCYRWLWFEDAPDDIHQQCMEKGSPRVTVGKPPDGSQCTQLYVGHYQEADFPTCDPICPNIFKGVSNLIVSGDCDNCVSVGDCSCNVKCVSGTKPKSGTPGSQTCTKQNSLVASFPAAPSCEPVCSKPNHDFGRLDVSKCQKDKECFGGDTCSPPCEVNCWNRNGYKTEFRSGGSPGIIQCVRLNSKLAEFTPLPKCEPVCEPPDDQFGTMDISDCDGRCYAGDYRNCKCSVKCYGRNHASSSAGRVGSKVCKFEAGSDETHGARGVWVDSDSSTWPGQRNAYPGYNEMPSCLSPLIVQVNNAQTGSPEAGVVVTLIDEDNPAPENHRSQTTNSGGYTGFYTSIRHIKLVVHKENYNDAEESIEREDYCREDPRQCRILLAISKKLDSGELNREGCFFIVKEGKVSFKIRAMLQWKQTPKDLDLWMRKVECAEGMYGTRLRYECYTDEERAAKNLEPTDDTCERTKFVESDTRNNEAQACLVRTCVEIKNSRAAETKFRDDDPDEPDCPRYFMNQFPKWVSWQSRMMEDLHKEIFKSSNGPYAGARTRPDSTAWDNTHNFLILDVDQRDGYGPETITMHNPAPGSYQIVVDQFTTDRANIYAGLPRIQITLGGQQQDKGLVQFQCAISPDCPHKSTARLWAAVTIKIVKHGTFRQDGTTYDKYFVRLQYDDKQEAIQRVSLPSSEQRERTTRWIPWKFGVMYPKPEEYYNFIVKEYDGAELTDICFGKCKAAQKYTEDHFSFCLSDSIG